MVPEQPWLNGEQEWAGVCPAGVPAARPVVVSLGSSGEHGERSTLETAEETCVALYCFKAVWGGSLLSREYPGLLWVLPAEGQSS